MKAGRLLLEVQGCVGFNRSTPEAKVGVGPLMSNHVDVSVCPMP